MELHKYAIELRPFIRDSNFPLDEVLKMISDAIERAEYDQIKTNIDDDAVELTRQEEIKSSIKSALAFHTSTYRSSGKIDGMKSSKAALLNAAGEHFKNENDNLAHAFRDGAMIIQSWIDRAEQSFEEHTKNRREETREMIFSRIEALIETSQK